MRNALNKLLCTVLIAALLFGCLGTAAAAGKQKANDPEIELFDTWYYVYETIPEGMRSSNFQTLYSMWDQNCFTQEDLISCEAIFVSGDEALKDAVTVNVYSYNSGKNSYTVQVNNEALTAPGKAEFRIVAETERYRWEEKGTLVVLDYNEYPLVTEKQSGAVYNAKIGDSFTDNEVMADLAEINAKDIAQKIKFKTSLVDIVQHSLDLSNDRDAYQGKEDDWRYAQEAIEFDNGYRVVGETEAVKTATVRKYGSHHLKASYSLGNVRYSVPFTVNVEGFAIETYDKPTPGSKLQFKAYGSEEAGNVTWSAEGEGVEIDEKGLLTISNDAPMGSKFMVKAVTATGKEASAAVVLNDGILEDTDFPTTREDDGFSVPVPGNGWYNDDFDLWYGDGYAVDAQYTGGNFKRYIDGKVFYTGTSERRPMVEDVREAEKYIDEQRIQESSEVTNVETEMIDIDGHPACLQTTTYFSEGAFYGHIGFIKYPRNDRLLRIRVYSCPIGIEGPEAVTHVSMQDLEKIASLIKYDPEKAPITAADTEITITAKENPTAVTAGKTVNFTATFANPQKDSAKEKNNGVNWTVVNADTGEEVNGVTIARGQLKVDKSLDAPVEIEVRAESSTYCNYTAYKLTAIPAASGIAVDPAELFFYVGKEDPQTVRAALTPDTVPLLGITWTPAKAGVVEITETEAGTVSIKPLTAGKTTIAVKEPGGKNAKLNVSVVDPVEAVELSLKGNVKAGGAVTVSAALQPKTAGNKNLEWSLDVGEDIATIDAKGKVTISKEAPSGTKITVTCKALGAPEPVISTIEIEIP